MEEERGKLRRLCLKKVGSGKEKYWENRIYKYRQRIKERRRQ